MKKLTIILLLSICIFIVGCRNELEIKTYEYTVEDVKVSNLSGKLTLPQTKNKVPSVIFLHGSGPSDMDGTINALKPYKELAEKLAIQGIASLRYHKRSYEFSELMLKNYEATIEDEYVDDAINAFNLLEEDNRINKDKIYLIGHSLGAQVTPLIINREPRIKGGILLAGTTEHILDLLLTQLKAQNVDNYDTYVTGVNITKALTSVKPGEEHYAYFGGYGAYWVHYNKIDWEKELLDATASHPMLIMQGGLDLQVFTNHFETYQTLLKNRKNITYKHYQTLNHCFVNGEGETIYSAYKTEKSIPDEVINDISNWIK